MEKRIIVVNAGPRKGWNTDTQLMEAAKGAEPVGAWYGKTDWPWAQQWPAMMFNSIEMIL